MSAIYKELFRRATTLLLWAVLAAMVVTTLAGCAGVMHVTNNFPPGRNEAGVGARNVNDVFMYSDTGETKVQEASSFMVGGSVAKPTEPVTMPDEPNVSATLESMAKDAAWESLSPEKKAAILNKINTQPGVTFSAPKAPTP